MFALGGCKRFQASTCELGAIPNVSRPASGPLLSAICYLLFAERERASGEFARSAAGRPDTRPGNPFFLREEIESHSSEQPFTLRNTNSLLLMNLEPQVSERVHGSRFAVRR